MNEFKPIVGGDVSQMDVAHLQMIRQNIRSFLARVGSQYATSGGRLLDIAPQVHEGARPHFADNVKVETLDIDPAAGATYTGDICKKNSFLPDGSFDFIVCTEVLEHTLQPFNAVQELHRLLAPGGLLFMSVPFNFRIHGPLPDCWRFTEYGLRVLLELWDLIELNALNLPDRFLMPVHYTIVAQKRKM